MRYLTLAKLPKFVWALLLVCLGETSGNALYAQQVGVNTPTPHPQAMLEVAATDRGIRIPRLSQAAIDAIDPAPAGMLVYNLDIDCLAFRNDTAWMSLCNDLTADCPFQPTAHATGNAILCSGETLYLHATPQVGATYYWTGPNGFESFAPSPSRPSITPADAGAYVLRTYRFGCYSAPDTVHVTLDDDAPHTSCQEILTAQPSSPSGIYSIDVNGVGCPVSCYCDMTTDGGGWTLVLNYLHLGGTNPVTQARTASLPLLSNQALGANEDATQFWGHAAPALLNVIPHTEFRFWAQTDNHGRMIHFKTAHANTLNYFRTGLGNMNGIQANFTALAGHTAQIPGGTNNGFANEGNAAMTNFPFYLTGLYHWGIRGNGNRWEVDDFPGNANHNTHHQIWVR